MTDEELLAMQNAPPFALGAGYSSPPPMYVPPFDNTGRIVDPTLLAQQAMLGQQAMSGQQSMPDQMAMPSQQYAPMQQRPSYAPLMTPENYLDFYLKNAPEASEYAGLMVPKFERYVPPAPASSSALNTMAAAFGGGSGSGGYDSGFGGGGGATFGGSGSLGISHGGSGTVGAPGAGTAEGDAAGNTEGSGGPADGSGTAGGGGGDGGGCVIATHAVSNNAFSRSEKMRAVKWCTENLHNKWWGEAFRRGYRFYGNKAIAAGTASHHYEEFRDFVRFATGKKRNMRTAKIFVLRSLQFFAVGLFLKGY